MTLSSCYETLRIIEIDTNAADVTKSNPNKRLK